MAELQFPDIVGQYRQGEQYGQQQRASKLAGLAYGAQGDARQSALGQLAGVNPQLAVGLGNSLQKQDAFAQQQAQTQQVDHAKKINGAARYMLQAVQSKDPARIQGAWDSVAPYLSEVTGKQAPAGWDDSMMPGLYQAIAATGGEPAAPAGVQEFEQMTQGLTQEQVAQARRVKLGIDPRAVNSGEVATLRAMQEDPALLQTYRQMHPRPAGGGMGDAPSGYRFTHDGSLEPIPGGPADNGNNSRFALTPEAIDNAAWNTILTGKTPSIGRGKEGIAQRTAIYNRMGEIASQAGVSPAELSTTAGRNKALQASLTNLQKISDVMEKSEIGFQNNTQTALELSSKIDRSGSPVVNKWVLGGRRAMGDPDVEALDAAITTMAVDYARIMSGATGAGGTPISTAEEAKSLIRKELSHKSFQAVIGVLNKDIAGQQRAVEHQRGKILGGMQALGVDQAPQQPATAPQTAPSGGVDDLLSKYGVQ